MDMMESLNFDPLGEVVGDHEHVNLLARGRWEFSDDVHPLFHEWPWGDDRGELLGWKMCNLDKALVAIAPLDEGDGVRPYSRPIVASSQGSVGQAVSFKVVATLLFMKFRQDVVSLCRRHSLEIWTGE